MTAGAYEQIKVKDSSASVIKIMEDMLKASEVKSNIAYGDAVEAYALLRINEVK